MKHLVKEFGQCTGTLPKDGELSKEELFTFLRPLVKKIQEELDELKEALDFSNWMRTCNATYVTIVSENPNCVGKSGVDAVVNGKLPDGSDYEWKKRR